MPTEPDDEELIYLPLPIDRAMLTWLNQISGGCDRAAGRALVDIVRDVMLDDERAHATLH